MTSDELDHSQSVAEQEDDRNFTVRAAEVFSEIEDFEAMEYWREREYHSY